MNFGCFALPAIRPADYDELMMHRSILRNCGRHATDMCAAWIERSEIRDPGCRPSPLKLRRANLSKAAEVLTKAASLLRAGVAAAELFRV